MITSQVWRTVMESCKFVCRPLQEFEAFISAFTDSDNEDFTLSQYSFFLEHNFEKASWGLQLRLSYG